MLDALMADDRAYYTRRALEEHTAAALATDQVAILAHMEIARAYEGRASLEENFIISRGRWNAGTI